MFIINNIKLKCEQGTCYLIIINKLLVFRCTAKTSLPHVSGINPTLHLEI